MTTHILSNGPPPYRQLDFRLRPDTRRRSMSGSRLSQRWSSRSRSLQSGRDHHPLQHAPFRPTVVQSEKRFITFFSCLSFSLFWFFLLLGLLAFFIGDRLVKRVNRARLRLLRPDRVPRAIARA